MYVSVARSCDEPNSMTPVSAGDTAAAKAQVDAVNTSFLNGNAAVYNLVQQLGGNMPGLIPGSPPSLPPAPPPPAPVYQAPGVLAAPAGPIVPAVIGGTGSGGGINLGSAVGSMVVGCDLPWASPSLGPQAPAAPAAPAGPSGMWLMGGLALAAAIWWLGSERGLK